MENKTGRSRRIRLIAAICAVVVLTGGAAGIYKLQKPDAQAASNEKETLSTSASADDGIISAGGTITSSQLTDSLGFENTSVQLTVEEILVESGENVTVGTPLYKLTSESLSKAEKTLKSELQFAKNALLEQKMSYQTDKNEAYTLYKSELLLGDTAEAEYKNDLSELDSELKKAKDSYQEALDTINDAPSEISSKQSELDAQQAYKDALQNEKNTLQQQLNEAEAEYTSVTDKYNSIVAEYNAAAGTVRYIGNSIGIDTSDITLIQSVSSSLSKQENSSGEKNIPAQENSGSDRSGMDMPDKPDDSSFSASMSSMPFYSPADFGTESTADNALASLYESAYSEYLAQKENQANAATELRAAESRYKELSASVNEYTSSIKEAENKIFSLTKEISTLNTNLSNSKSNLNKLRSEYNSLNASYSSDQLELQKKLDTDKASYENAEYHYQITCNTIEEELEEKQNAYDTAEKNLSIFSDELSDGYIYAKQDGMVYSLNYQEGRGVNVNSPYVSYVDKTAYSTVVELDQNDVTQVSIGDIVMIQKC